MVDRTDRSTAELDAAVRAQAAQVLGSARLRRDKALIRPDLYGARDAQTRAVQKQAGQS